MRTGVHFGWERVFTFHENPQLFGKKRDIKDSGNYTRLVDKYASCNPHIWRLGSRGTRNKSCYIMTGRRLWCDQRELQALMIIERIAPNDCKQIIKWLVEFHAAEDKDKCKDDACRTRHKALKELAAIYLSTPVLLKKIRYEIWKRKYLKNIHHQCLNSIRPYSTICQKLNRPVSFSD